MKEPRSIPEGLSHATTVPSGPHPNPLAEPLPPLPAVTVAPAPAPAADFELSETIGVGGMGRVVHARQTALDRAVAAKFLKDPEGDASALLREALVTGRLEHPNIVPVHLLAVTGDGAPFFAMKRVGGTPWSDALARGQPLVDALEVLLKVCDAVSFAHARGVLHRDIKPDNVLIGSYGEVYLVDWGLAVSLTVDQVLPLAQTSDFAGTPAYMAPEMAAGLGPALCVQSDVYLLGATLYEVLTGRLPHRAPTPAAVVSVALEGRAPQFDQPVPPELASICRRAMAKAPAERYPTAVAFKEALASYLRHREAWVIYEQARQRLSQLEQLAHQERAESRSSTLGITAHTAYAECRFGFEQVRRLWPEFEGARQGLTEAIVHMGWHEVRHDDARAARILTAQLDVVPPELLSAIEQLEQRQYQRDARLFELERDARDLEIDVVLREKRVFSLGFGFVVLLGGLTAQLLTELGWLVPTTGLGLVVFAVPVVSSELFGRMLRRAREGNAAQLRLGLALRASAWSSVGFWVMTLVAGLRVETALTFYLVFIAGNWLVSSALFHPRGVIVALGVGLGAVGTLIAPRFAYAISAICSFGGFAVLSWSLRERIGTKLAR
ncbi:MAG: serine/threonine-protein kinase [Myxococcaceae bacterium]|nr:serine/threonine-protein kinase [Myxococcaceae bacterium]